MPWEIAFKGWITSDGFFKLSQKFMKSDYGKYLMKLLDSKS